MAQVMVNFRIDEDVKKQMEQACREMGLSMTAAFTIFATKVGKEKRIPFEITANTPTPDSLQKRRPPEFQEFAPGMPAELLRTRGRLESLWAQVRRSLTSIHTAIPSSITGLTMERIRLLCGDELKDKAMGAAAACRALFSEPQGGLLDKKDGSLLDEYADALSAVAEELAELERTLIPAMKAHRGGESGGFTEDAHRLAAVSQRLDALGPMLERFLRSTACQSSAQRVRTRLQQAAAPVETPYVRTALENLEQQVLQCWDGMEEPSAARLEADYLQTLELTLRELRQAEEAGEETSGRAALCLRAVNVLSQMISDSGRLRREWSRRSLEAEVEALERLAAMRGDISGIRLEE